MPVRRQGVVAAVRRRGSKSRYLAWPRDTILGGVGGESPAARDRCRGGGRRRDDRAAALQSEVAKVYETVNTEQMPLIRKSRQQRLSAQDVAEVLGGLNWLCNEELEKRQVVCSLWQTISPSCGMRIDSYY